MQQLCGRFNVREEQLKIYYRGLVLAIVLIDTISVVKLMVSCLQPQMFESKRNSDSKPVCV